MSQLPLMKCGHTGYATDTATGKHCCPICGTPEAHEEVEVLPNIEGRQAKCAQCGKLTPSKFNLPFFVPKGIDSRWAQDHCVCWFHRTAHERTDYTDTFKKRCCDDFTSIASQGGSEFDEYYCGCRGWD